MNQHLSLEGIGKLVHERQGREEVVRPQLFGVKSKPQHTIAVKSIPQQTIAVKSIPQQTIAVKPIKTTQAENPPHQRIATRRARKGKRQAPTQTSVAPEESREDITTTQSTTRTTRAGPFRYYVHNGNNATLIRKQFKERKGWSAALKPWELGALNNGTGLKHLRELGNGITDFIWCQYKSQLGDFDYYATSWRNKVNNCIVLNHFENGRVLVHKAKLYETLQSAGKLDYVPFTRVIDLDEWTSQHSDSLLAEGIPDGVFILKPGQGTNRGFGISVVHGLRNAIDKLTEYRAKQGEIQRKKRSLWILQKYIERPLLVKGRKFDVRCYGLLVYSPGSTNASNQTQELKDFRAYLHQNAYLRTSSFTYSLGNLDDTAVHLTNDAVQKKNKAYGKLESGNKLSLDEFGDILQQEGSAEKEWVLSTFWPCVQEMSSQVFQAGIHAGINPKLRPRCFELFGFDFMVECGDNGEKHVRLIEVNDNPCLEEVCPLLKAIIPKVIDDTFNIVLDATFFCNTDSDSPEREEHSLCPDNRFTRLF